MKRIDASPEGIFDIAWSPDGKWVAYVAGVEEVRLANVETGEIRVIGPGRSPNITIDNRVIIERNEEISLVSSDGERIIVAKKDLVKDTPKCSPVLSPDSSTIVFAVMNVFDKVSQAQNAYPYRHFVAIAPVNGGKPILTTDQWYGGTVTWFPDGKRFAHFEFDSTSGPQIHVISADGKREGTMAGLYPSVSPDGTHLAARPKGGGTLVVYTTKGAWNDEEIETAVWKIPAAGQSSVNATPPMWLDNRHVIVAEGGSVWRMDTRRDKSDEMKKLPVPTERRKYSMISSPSRELIAAEVACENGFELRVASLV